MSRHHLQEVASSPQEETFTGQCGHILGECGPRFRQLGEAKETLQLDIMLCWLGEGGLSVYVDGDTGGRRPSPDLNCHCGNYPANYPGRIPPVLKHSAASLYDLRKLSVLFYCSDLTLVSLHYSCWKEVLLLVTTQAHDVMGEQRPVPPGCSQQ